jgi:hypothetical protein
MWLNMVASVIWILVWLVLPDIRPATRLDGAGRQFASMLVAVDKIQP